MESNQGISRRTVLGGALAAIGLGAVSPVAGEEVPVATNETASDFQWPGGRKPIDLGKFGTPEAIAQAKAKIQTAHQVVVLKFQEGGYSTGSGPTYTYHYADIPVYCASSSPGAPVFEQMTVPPTTQLSCLATAMAQLFDLGFHVAYQGEWMVVMVKS